MTTRKYDPMREVLGALWDEMPAIRPLLMNLSNRNKILVIINRHMAPRHTLAQCAAASRAAGLRPRASSQNEHFTGKSQKARVLAAYELAGSQGLNAWEAQQKSGLSEQSCYWKRVSELLHNGLLEELDDGFGHRVTRPGPTGAERDVYVISALGRSRLANLQV